MSYVNLSLIVKYIYTGCAEMAEDRVKGFIIAAKSVELVGMMKQEELGITKKVRTASNKKKNSSKSADDSEEQEEQEDASTSPDSNQSGVEELPASPETPEPPQPKRRSLISGDRKRKLHQVDEDPQAAPTLKHMKTDQRRVQKCCEHCYTWYCPLPDSDDRDHEMFCEKRLAVDDETIDESEEADGQHY